MVRQAHHERVWLSTKGGFETRPYGRLAGAWIPAYTGMTIWGTGMTAWDGIGDGNDGWWGGIGEGQPQGLPLRQVGRGLISEESFMSVVTDTTNHDNGNRAIRESPLREVDRGLDSGPVSWYGVTFFRRNDDMGDGNDGCWGGIGDGQPQGLPLRWAGWGVDSHFRGNDGWWGGNDGGMCVSGGLVKSERL